MSDLCDGVTIKLGGRDFVVPPLNMKSVRAVEPLLPDLNGDNGPEKANAALFAVIQMAMRRNYPGITVEELEELIDLGNLAKVASAALAGFGPKALIGLGLPSG